MRQRLCFAILAVATPAAGFAQQIDISVGASYSSGHYGATDRTELATTYVNLGVSRAGWRLDTTLPYLSLRSGGAPVDIGGITLPGGQRTKGLGDLTIRASRSLTSLAPFEVTFGGQVKIPTGNANLSTGKFDGRLGVELARDLGALSPFVAVGYNTYGDSRRLELQDGWSLSAGSSATLGSTALIGSYDWSQSSVGGPTSHELSAVAAGQLAPGWGWTAFGSKGLSSGAADFLFGAGITRTFGGTERGPVRRPRRS